MSKSAPRSSAQIRQDFLDFFASKGHTVVPSSPLVPGNDPTLLFTNAGMVQFKDVFLGAEKRSYTRAVSSQRCVRAGGKHNDLDQVGYTARHHTFFEMLGNFSFGDYFKKDAIAYAWELLTGVWQLPKEKLLVTIYHTDDEAFDIWHKDIGLPPERIIRIGDNKGAPYASDNFWQMADTGPCGPCTEIFYDHGEHIAGGPPGSPDEDGDRYIEIWNNVFMQFDRQPDGTLLPLPAPCVDTGMGLERIAAVLQHVHSNYEIDLFEHLIRRAAELTHTADLGNKSLRVIADHIRACAFLIADGVLPSNEGRGYVLRRIIRRAVRHLWKLGALKADGLFWRMLAPLAEKMGEAYPELNAKRALIEQALKAEEAAFASTLDAGMQKLDGMLAEAGNTVSGEQLFLLHDTFGCPPDLILDILRERGLEPVADAMPQYEALMDQQRERARAAGKFGGSVGLPAELVASLHPTEFKGYETLELDGCKVVALLKDNQPVPSLAAGEHGVVVLDRTPFYAESGGQAGDAGLLCSGAVRFAVTDTQKLSAVFHGHAGRLETGSIALGDKLSARVDGARRQATVLNHSATHLLHAALRKVLGEHVSQKGSLVTAERTRFDFSHFQAVSAEQLQTIEDLVNAEIRRNAEAEVHHMGMQEALDFGAMALFGEKYGERVRVLRMGEFSTELCGGTHVHRTGDIGVFKILSEAGIAAGVRRIEATTGASAVAAFKHSEATLQQAAELVGARGGDVLDKLSQLLERQKKLERELEAFKAKAASGQSSDLAAKAAALGPFKLVKARVAGVDGKGLRELVDNLKTQLPDSVIVLASGQDGKVSLVAGVQGAAQATFKAGEVLSHIAVQIGGKGGGRPDFAQGGGEDGPALDAALAGLDAWLAARLT
ncbi:alanine--tRNA ligase [Arenimonas maotaiensis]|uniref:Alanine--tRNA ligase n=1 Tax=Arenimonas maotaiensis TaxID=1446479 RepID=A0A917CMI8_9GAMM|nr:alanine--tRNA ligase [Arenimonas maotaiensis]GGF92103.1 alanine--tRNA ligase [Arenimonas maotaiensis]